MSNEAIMISTALVDLAVVLLAFRLGRVYLVSVLAINLIMVSLTAAKAGTVFGIVASPQSIFYASIFLGTDLLTEYYGKKAGYQAVAVGFASLLLMVILGQAVVNLVPVESSATIGAAIDSVFGVVGRIALASFVAYLIAQNVDIWLFHKIKDHTNGKHLWLRNNGSTWISQALDTVIFFPIAFWGVMPNNQLLSIMGFAYIVKILVAMVDTPFVYMASKFKPSELK